MNRILSVRANSVLIMLLFAIFQPQATQILRMMIFFTLLVNFFPLLHVFFLLSVLSVLIPSLHDRPWSCPSIPSCMLRGLNFGESSSVKSQDSSDVDHDAPIEDGSHITTACV